MKNIRTRVARSPKNTFRLGTAKTTYPGRVGNNHLISPFFVTVKANPSWRVLKTSPTEPQKLPVWNHEQPQKEPRKLTLRYATHRVEKEAELQERAEETLNFQIRRLKSFNNGVLPENRPKTCSQQPTVKRKTQEEKKKAKDQENITKMIKLFEEKNPFSDEEEVKRPSRRNLKVFSVGSLIDMERRARD